MPFTEKASGGIYSLGPHIIQRWLFHCAWITYSFSLTRTRARTRTMTRPLLAQSGTQNWEEFCQLNLELQLDKKCFLLAAWTYKALRGLESPTSVGLISYNAHNIHLDFGSEFIIGSQYFFSFQKKIGILFSLVIDYLIQMVQRGCADIAFNLKSWLILPPH